MGDQPPDDPLPRARDAQIDPAKFTTYSMNPSNPGNGGKRAAFAAVGYDVHDAPGRLAGAEEVIGQLRVQILSVTAREGKASLYGRRYEVRTRLRGPNSTEGTLVTIWQVDRGSETPRLITNWLEVYR